MWLAFASALNTRDVFGSALGLFFVKPSERQPNDLRRL